VLVRRTTRPPRFSGRDPFRRGGKASLLAAWRSAWSRVRSLLPWGSSLKFAGRTPNASGFGAPSSPPRSLLSTARAVALGAMLLLLLSSAFVATRRDSIGSQVPWPAARPLRIFDSSARNNAPSTWARARLVPVPRSWSETFWALPTFAGELSHRLAPREVGARAAVTFIVLAWPAASGVARGGSSWRLEAAFARAGTLAARARVRRLLLAGHDARANPQDRALKYLPRLFLRRAHHRLGWRPHSQQSIDWHRARGFSGLVLSDLRSGFGSASVWRGNPDMILISGAEKRDRSGAQIRALVREEPTLLSMYADVATISQQIRQAGGIAIKPRPWREPTQLGEQLRVTRFDAVEAWAGNTGDENLARQARARGLAVVGSASLGAGSDCYVWGLVPSSARTPQDVLRAVKNRRVAVAYALLKDETPANLDEKREASRALSAPIRAWKQAVSQLSPAERLNLRLQLLALVLGLFLWGARASQVLEVPQGPASAAKFLRRKRLLRRANGLATMLLALVGTLALASSALGEGGWKYLLPASLVAPAVFLGWLALDALYLYGRSVWKRVH
jgi:hypothetical protein